MSQLTSREQESLDRELARGERVLWTGKPQLHVIFHASDWANIPISLLIAAFSIVWEAGVSGFGPFGGKHEGASIFMQLWGVPFVIVGQYQLWGRFFYAAWLKKRILYAITSERVLTLVLSPRRKMVSHSLRDLRGMTKDSRADGIGTLKFGEVPPLFAGRGQKTANSDGLFLNAEAPVFVDICDVDSVEKVAQEQGRKLVKESSPPPNLDIPATRPMFSSFYGGN